MKNKGTLLIGASIAILVGFIIYSAWLVNRPQPVYLQGEIEATQIRVSSKLAGRLATLEVRRGDTVSAGQLLFTIASPEVDARLAQAKAALSGAEATSKKAVAGAQIEDIQAAYNTYLKAKSAADLAQKTLARVSNLFKDGVVPAQKMDEAQTNYDVSVQTANAAQAIWEKAKNGARSEDKDAAWAMVQRAKGAVDEVESYRGETRINAPARGEVANIMAEAGELVPTGYPVVTIADLSDCWAVFSLREDLLAGMSKGTTFMAAIPALGEEKYQFTVSYIAAMGNFATWNATKTAGEWDMKTFEVHARPVAPIAGLRPGMSVLVEAPAKK